MAGRARLVELPVYQSYDCHSCSRCCRGWFEVPVTPAERERILAQGWGERLGLPPGGMFVPKGDAYRLAHRPAGDCVFLGDDGYCRIHAEFGILTKPLACQIYPYHFVPGGDGVRLEVRFDCPSAAGNRGRPLSEQRSELTDLLSRQAGELVESPPAPPVADGVPGTWPLIDHLTALALDLAGDEAMDVTTRIAALARLTMRLSTTPCGALTARELERVLATLVSRARDEAGAIVAGGGAPPPGGMTRALFRQLLASYARADRVDAKVSRAARLRTAVRMLAGSGPIPRLREDLPPAMFAATEDVRGFAAASGDLIGRYLRLRLSSRGFCGRSCYGLAFCDGLAALLLTFPLAGWFARMLAAAEGRDAVLPADAERAVGIVDGAHGRSALLAMPSEQKRIAHLTRPEPLLVLIRWYGR